jgi:hypothetical protein
MPGSDSGRWGRFYYGLDNRIVVLYSLGPIITLHRRINAKEYVDRLGTQVHPTIQMSFPNNDAVVQEGSGHSDTAGIVQS